MKKLNAMLITGSLLVAGAVVTPAHAYGNDWNNNNNHQGWSNWRNNSNNNQYVNQAWNNRYVRTNPYWNTNGNGQYNDYTDGYYSNNPGFFKRLLNRIF